MARRGIRSITVPITFGAVTVPLSVFLLVGWTTFTARNIAESGEVAQNVWLLILGVLSLIVIMSVLVMFSIFLVREILEVRRQDSFIDSVTHELKTPLASIKLCLQTLERSGIPQDKRAALQKMMHHDVDRLATFIDDVLQASRLAHDDMSMDVDEVRLGELATSCAAVVSMRHKVPEGAIRVEVDPELVVWTDHAALEIVLRNLIDNAVKYSKDGVDVRVGARVDEVRRVVFIEVRDAGIGIPRKDLKRIFHRFYRVAEEGVRARKGTGLGLFVVSALVRNLGGHVEAESDGVGKGAILRVRLPMHEHEQASRAVASPA
ncbi:sensor histidine kinase [Sandaracinus amylolyticus]|uniref:histidine kinase n=1 Tax=Sandaracinus amylolyticus TaxID=927083 RepID=A0A0F6YGA3_9BACT|nr:HAMP domain-containing sensor histidine kinase [Sandaracinus amylolyticus]AKF03685.1 Phosphate regulon sensor protein PhoR [Sandaracinus amylolyticus]